ncbi:hypothetical protein J6590_087877, partial [Homalodisca vitripennis]
VSLLGLLAKIKVSYFDLSQKSKISQNFCAKPDNPVVVLFCTRRFRGWWDAPLAASSSERIAGWGDEPRSRPGGVQCGEFADSPSAPPEIPAIYEKSREAKLSPSSNSICFFSPPMERTLFCALPLGQRLQCPECLEAGILCVRKREGMKRHLNQDHGGGWEMSFVCCDIEFSCRQQKYALKQAKAHFASIHPGADFFLPDGELGVCASSYNTLQEKIVRMVTPIRPPAPDAPPSSDSSPAPSPSPPLVRHRSAAAIARNALRRRRPVAEEHVTPPRVPLNAVAPYTP